MRKPLFLSATVLLLKNININTRTYAHTWVSTYKEYSNYTTKGDIISRRYSHIKYQRVIEQENIKIFFIKIPFLIRLCKGMYIKGTCNSERKPIKRKTQSKNRQRCLKWTNDKICLGTATQSCFFSFVDFFKIMKFNKGYRWQLLQNVNDIFKL
jgi:hypothetical protein